MESFPYTHEANVSFVGGFITFPISFNFYGPGTIEDGVENMLWLMFPKATKIVVRPLNQE